MDKSLMNKPSTSATPDASFSDAFSSLDLLTQPSTNMKRDINDSTEWDDPEYFASGSEYSEGYSPSPSEYLEQGKSYTPEPSTGHNFNHRFVCIEYPGLVQDEEKMLKTLGGLDGVSTAFSKKNRRVELRFRPDDIYCKPACGNKHQITGLLIKVKIRRKKTTTGTATEGNKTPSAVSSSESDDPKTLSSNEENEKKLSEPESSTGISRISVLGQIRSIYRFRNLCDFQYVPTDGKTCIYDQLMPDSLPPTSWLYEHAEYFLPPPAFSRMDTMQGYWYQKDKKASAVPRHIIGCTRQRRASHAMFITFDATEIPNKPRASTLRTVTFKNLDGEPLARLTKLFEQRPIWAKNALMTVGKYSKDQIKYLLPCVAYYFVTGPWRIMWCRFGFDPRVNVSARNLQTLDYRLRTAGGLKTKVKAKRNYASYLLPYKSTPDRAKIATISKDNVASSSVPEEESIQDDTSYIFRPGTLPPSRQMFYQYCDLHVPSIQAMLDKLPTLPPGTVCHERNGWMPHGLDFLCRDIINNLVLETLKADAGEQYVGLPQGPKSGQAGNDEDDEEEDDDDEGGMSYDEMEEDEDWEMAEEG